MKNKIIQENPHRNVRQFYAKIHIYSFSHTLTYAQMWVYVYIRIHTAQHCIDVQALKIDT